MSLLSIRATIKAEAVPDVEASAAELFAALDRLQPDNIRYGSCRLVDGRTYLILLQVDDGTENPLPALPEFQRFQAGLRGWADGPPDAAPANVIGSYRLFT